ncbi:acetoin utilization protein AcuC [Pseudactinotalea suaedae]|uniref:acetoin utilization protein AcuC n=1 Tax=Pseudactinotalea suaedae TaxID=1524924 RepID=UPI0012E206A0|nr:acetoin utilization protein AcuC [Pseudactinotalea suaedae]
MAADERAMLLWTPELLSYDFGPGHPMSPLRLRLTMELVSAFGLLDRLDVVAPEPVDDATLRLVHEQEYIDHVRAEDAGDPPSRWGLGGPDNPVFAHMHEASARIVGGTVAATRAVWRGEKVRAVNPAGGMHHAMARSASGFCVYNDVAVGIAAALAEGAERVLYVDVDAHHGDGVERAFWDDPRVLTISVHQTGQSVFPGTGYAQDAGGPRARGFAVNVALPPRTADAAWLRTIEAIVEPLAQEWRPQLVVSQHGADAHGRDPITDLDISVDAQRAAALMVCDLAERFAEGRWVATGGGGYDLVSTVPRAWTHLVAVVAGAPIDPGSPTPPAWLEYVGDLLGRDGPATMTEGRPATFRPWEEGYDPEDPVDRAILATRRSVFPEHGLDPLVR